MINWRGRENRRRLLARGTGGNENNYGVLEDCRYLGQNYRSSRRSRGIQEDGGKEITVGSLQNKIFSNFRSNYAYTTMKIEHKCFTANIIHEISLFVNI
jgi:hypothetical protein